MPIVNQQNIILNLVQTDDSNKSSPWKEQVS